ncbi:lysylphosphatidylglycerol synthase transmembrane domain-containing protein [Mariprofundus erugo]|uniref:lysylphosphatidylglycerol synthase transmembrane domain-containing protein n=1 Tax=Mariprofundus erugo TaxID=2528639 RepID=UPI0019310B41|nr:lysylphosphatidylglycerol synthase transmembrane domain-containing protein [Mariprofundus erugo]
MILPTFACGWKNGWPYDWQFRVVRMIWLKITLSLLLLGYLGWTLDGAAIAHQLMQVQWLPVLAATACLIVGQLFSAWRWVWLARALGLTVDAARKIQLYFLGMFLSLFLPSIIGGDVARGWLLARGRAGSGWLAAASVVLERLNGMVGLLLLISFCMLYLVLPEWWRWSWFAGLLLFLLLMLATPKWWPWLQGLSLTPRWSGWQQLPLASPQFSRAWMQSLPLSLLFQGLVVQAHVLLGQAVGLELSWFAYGFMVCLVALASALPLSFNGFGIREAGYVGFSVWFGGTAEAAGAMAVLWVLVLAVASLPGGIVLWRLGGASILRRDQG